MTVPNTMGGAAAKYGNNEHITEKGMISTKLYQILLVAVGFYVILKTSKKFYIDDLI